jgi:hypothetical protein
MRFVFLGSPFSGTEPTPQLNLELSDKIVASRRPAGRRVQSQALGGLFLQAGPEPSRPVANRSRKGALWVQQWIRLQAGVYPSARPRVVGRFVNEPSAHRVQLNVAHGSPEMRLIQQG